MGIQSFDDRLLQLLRRVHTSAEAFAALEAVRTGGVTNVSADLIYGLPGQSPEDAETDARSLIELGVTHASAYSLIVEEGTMLKRLVRKGEILLPEDRVTEEAGERVCHTLEKGGLKRYEISAYAAEGFNQSIILSIGSMSRISGSALRATPLTAPIVFQIYVLCRNI